MVLVVASAEPLEAHVHGFEHFFNHGFVDDADGSGFVALDGLGGLRPAHFHESVSKGYHDFGADEES